MTASNRAGRVFVFSHAKLIDFAHVISDALSFNSIDNEFCTEIDPSLYENLWIGIWHRSQVLPPKRITYNTEALRLPKWFNSMPSCFSGSLDIWDYSSVNIPIIKSWGINDCFHLPMAYSPYYERSFRSDIKDIDVFMYGAQSKRRQAIIDDLRVKGLKTVWCGEHGDFDYGHQRDELIGRSKIVVSVCSESPELFQTNDFSRLSFLIANKVFTVSERIGDSVVEDQWNDKITMRQYGDIVDACLYYVGKEKERRDCVEKAYAYAIENFNMRKLLPVDRINRLL